MNKYLLLTLLILVSLWSLSSLSIPVEQKPIEAIASSTPNIIATTTQKVATTTKPIAQTVAKPEKKISSSTPIVTLPPEPAPDFVKINEDVRKSIVNIFCTTKTADLSPISGTGTIINADGLILTNAHIGQYFLLKDVREKDFVQCVVRTGSPAYPRYHAELVYISPTWVANNKTILKEENPKGTGENDYAFIRITDAIDKTNLPKFDYTIPNLREVINIGEPVLLASYPAGFLGGISITYGVNVASAITNIADIFTYSERFVDLISVPGTILSQKGASGGAVADKHGSLLGIISTSSEENSTSQRDLRAITLAYINRDMQKELGFGLDTFMSKDLHQFAIDFQKNTAPELIKTITEALNP